MTSQECHCSIKQNNKKPINNNNKIPPLTACFLTYNYIPSTYMYAHQ